MLANLTSYLARQAASKPRSEFSRAARRISSNLVRQCRIALVLARPQFAPLVAKYPYLLYKYIEDCHLAQRLTVAQRAACHHHHYRYLLSRFPDPLLAQVLDRGVTLSSVRREQTGFAIALKLADPWLHEGELSLNLLADGVPFYNLSFSFVPGSTIGLGPGVRDAILVSRLQGQRGCQPQVRQAFRALRDRPATLLLAALGGLAQALGITAVEIASACNQSSLGQDQDQCKRLRRPYDEFLLSQGAILGASGYFHLPVPLPERPFELVSRNNRARAHKRRAFKSQLTAEVVSTLRASLESQPSPAKPAANHPSWSLRSLFMPTVPQTAHLKH